MIIWINGSINSGKTTISKLLGEKFDKPAVIEIDEIRHFISHTGLSEAIPINLENTLLITKNFLKYGYTVIIPYPLSEDNKLYIQNYIAKWQTDFKIFSLAPDIDIALSDRG